MRNKTIIYTGGFRFPNGDAASQRVLNNAKIFRELGYTVEFVSWGGMQREEDKHTDGFYYYQGFKYINTNDIDNKENLSVFGRVKSFFKRGENSLSIIESRIKKVNIIIAYNPPAYFTNKLLSTCNKEDVLFISDITEWYSSNEILGGKFAPPYWISEYNMRVIQKKVQNKILISSFLDTHFSDSNNIILPPLVDMQDEKWLKNKSVLPVFDGLRIIYAGSPGKKDKLDTILEAVIESLKEGANIQLVVLGVSKNDIVNYSCYSDVIAWSDNILFLGRVPQEDVPTFYKASDFSILVREDNRKNKAGFPTKLIESLTAGCPIIVNYTSDISEYVKNETNGIVIADFTKDAVKKALEKATSIDGSCIKKMKSNATLLAENKFDYRSYEEGMVGFFNR